MGAFLAIRIEVRQTLETLYILKPSTVFLLHSRSLESLSQASKLAVFFFFLAFCAIPAARNESKSWFFVFGGKSEIRLTTLGRETGWTVKPSKVDWVEAFVPGGKNERFSYCVLMMTSIKMTGNLASRFCNNLSIISSLSLQTVYFQNS